MKNIYIFMIFTFSIFICSCNNSGTTSENKNIVSSSTSDQEDESKKQIPIVIIGPSTVYIEKYPDNKNPFRHYSDDSSCRLYGWGELLPEVLKEPNSVYNFAQPGATAQTFLIAPEKRKKNEQILFGPNRDHYWAKAKEKMQILKNGILLIQFGGNDKRVLEEKYNHDNVRIETAFKDSIQFYIDEAKSLNFTPVLISSIERRSFDKNGNLKKSRGDFPQWMRELAQTNGLEFLDLNQKSFDEYSKYNQDELNSKFADCYNKWRYNDLVRNYHLSKEEAKKEAREDTHFERKGARIVAGWIKDLACEDKESLLCKQFR